MSRTRRRPVRLATALLGLALVGSTGAVSGRTADLRPLATDDQPAAALAAAIAPDEQLGAAASSFEGGLQPGIQYEDALAHADDPNTFEPGGRVHVGFRPRPGDTWSVGGKAPRSLPPGQATGAEMELTPQGSAWVRPARGQSATEAPATDDPVDGPVGAPGETVPADSTAAFVPSSEATADPQASGLRREVFGFLPYWEVSDASTTYRYDLLSTIAYFSVGADRYGNLMKKNSDGSTTTGWGGWTSSKMTAVINGAHAAGTRVVLTISCFAWTTSGANTQAALLGSPEARLRLAQQAVAAVRDRGADGINLDFEPIVSGYADEFTALVRTIRAELDKVAPGYQLTFDTTGWIGNYPIEAATAPGGADAIFIMGYDYRNGGASTAGSVSPLTGPIYDLTETVAAYTARVPASKLILGVPYYGRAWSTETDQVRSKNISGTKYGSSVTVLYETALGLAAEHGRRWDATEQTPWTAYRKETCTSTYGCVTAWRQLYYDDAESLAAKYDLVNLRGLRGAGIWALGYDWKRPELWNALAAKFQDDTTVPLAGITPLPAASSSETFTVSWTGLDDRGVVSWDVDVSIDGGPWMAWRRKTSATSAPYVGASGHGFAFRVRGRDAAGNVGSWGPAGAWTQTPVLAVGGFGRVVVNSVNVRAGPSTGATIVTVAEKDTILAIAGGPVSADGYTWWKVSLPVVEWPAVSPLTSDVWVASGSSSTTLVVAAAAPNTTSVAGSAPRPAGARFSAVVPARILDTRSGTGLSGPFRDSVVRSFVVAGRGGVPAGAVAVTGNLTVTRQSAAGYVSLGPTVSAAPATSSLNIPRGDTRAVTVTMPLSSTGTLAAVWKGGAGSSADLIFDVTGYFVAGPSGATYAPLAPTRILDTRAGNGLSGAFRSGIVRTLAVTGRGGVPADAVAVTGNLTITAQTSTGYVSLGPTMSATPSTSTLNAPRGDDRANGVTVKLSGTGSLAAVWKGTSGSTAHLVFDVTGYFTASSSGATFHPVDPVRLLDTRVGNGLGSGLATAAVRSFVATGRGTIPYDALALAATLTITGQTSAGYLALGPSVTSPPGTSSLNAPRGDNRANGLVSRVGGKGSLGIVWIGARGSTTHAILDVAGYFR